MKVAEKLKIILIMRSKDRSKDENNTNNALDHFDTFIKYSPFSFCPL